MLESQIHLNTLNKWKSYKATDNMIHFTEATEDSREKKKHMIRIAPDLF